MTGIIREERTLANSVAAIRFEDKCVDVLPSGCRIWMGAVNEQGYGILTAWGRRYKAHRAAWEIFHGSAPESHVLHRCDVPSCVNPDHLFVGTQGDNMRDMAMKGRGGVSRPTGETQGSSKLTEGNVRDIRKLYAAGVKQKEIASKFGIHRTNVSLIVLRKGWKHVSD